jgi:tripartite-type tricarboxylate transporter receptor subunit TctC
VIVENRPGAASMIATRLAAAATANGHSILINSNTLVVNQILNANAGYDIERQFTPVVNLAWQPNIIAATQALPASNLRDLIAHAKTAKLGYGTPGQGSMPHLAAVFLFNRLAKVDILHVPFSGAAPALTATIAGQPELSVVTLPPAVPLVKAGRLKGIVVTSAKRAGALPDVPTVAESGFPGYEVNVFSGFFVPRVTPAAAVERLRATVLRVLAQPEIQAQLATMGFEPADNTTDDFPQRVARELRLWNKVLAGIKLN